MSTHYIAVLVPEPSGVWSVLFPDLPGCAAQGESVQEAVWMAVEAAAGHVANMRDLGVLVPAPRELAAVRADDAWRAEYGFDWASVVISLIEVEGAPQPE